MIIDQDDDLDGFSRRPRAGPGWGEILVSVNDGKPVILLHEIPSITPEVMYLARVIAASGFRVYLPSFMGRPGRNPGIWDQTGALWKLCVNEAIGGLRRGEHTRPAAVGLRALAREISDDHGGAGVGIVGLCMTGGFALATATEPVIRASVACEPSLPISLPLTAQDGIDISPDDQKILAARMASGDLAAMLYRFQGDKISPCKRLGRCGELFGAGFASRCLPDAAADPARKGFPPHHCVVTNHLVEAQGSLTLAARDEILAFLKWRLCDGPAPAVQSALRDCLRSGCARGDRLGPRADT